MKISRKSPHPKNADVGLLRAVIATGAILFALKVGGIALTASAATNAPLAPPAAAAPAKPAATPAAISAAAKPGVLPDPLAAINAALPRPAKPATPADAVKGADDPSSDLVANVSSAEMDVLTSLADRRDALEQRQRELDLRANILVATEKRVDDKIGQLKALQSRIEAMLGQRDAKELEQLDGLVKIYTAMKPKDAARIFAALDDTVRIGVAARMKADIMAGIMAALPSDVAQKLTVELASRYKAPTDAAALSAPAGSAAQSAGPTAAAPSSPAASAARAPAPAPKG
jgi:flagellar motility protein MotE (MotC chaperone)